MCNNHFAREKRNDILSPPLSKGSTLLHSHFAHFGARQSIMTFNDLILVQLSSNAALPNAFAMLNIN